jgi:hypothetical protein
MHVAFNLGPARQKWPISGGFWEENEFSVDFAGDAENEYQDGRQVASVREVEIVSWVKMVFRV